MSELGSKTDAGAEAPVPPARVIDQPGIVTDDPEHWHKLLWLRDQAATGDATIAIGRAASVAALLLSRSGTAAKALDPDRRCIADVLALIEARAADTGAPIEIRELDERSLEGELRSGDFGVAVVTDGYGSDLARLLRILASQERLAKVIVAVTFGGLTGPYDRVFPATLVYALAGFSAEQLEVSGGRILAVMSRRPGAAAELDLLRLTEDGAAQELAILRTRVAEAQFQLSEAKDALEATTQVALDLEESTSFRLGQALVLAARSPREIFLLPSRIASALKGRSVRRSKLKRLEAVRTGLSEWEKEALRDRVRRASAQGLEAVEREIERFMPDAPVERVAFGYLTAAQACAKEGDHALEFQLAQLGLGMHRSIGMLRGFLHVALRAREMAAASATLRELHQHAARGNALAKQFLHGFKQTSSYKIAVLERIPPRPEQWREVEGSRLAYVLHNSLPYSSGGYATRSQGVAKGLAERGRDIVCVTRPGFPLDVSPGLAPVDMPIVDHIDGVPYQRVVEPRRVGIPEYQYVTQAMHSMENELRKLHPSYVQAASNYVTALPALVAARRLGIPFFYEVRGLWEITRMSRDQQFAESISFDVQRHIEATVAREADHVFTLTEPMREELIARGVEPGRITLLPNSVDARRFTARARDEQLSRQLGILDGVPVIGYIGTFVVYEGLEDLAAACAQLHLAGRDFRLLLVGNENASGQERGPISAEILRIAEEAGFASKLIMPGRIPHEQVEAYYSLIDICPFPRKPWPVCEMVSPMKPLEALAMKKAVVVSSVRALVEMIRHGRTGLVFDKGDVSSLAEAIATLMSDPALRTALGEAGREWVLHERSWAQVADRVEEVIATFDRTRAEPKSHVAEADATNAP